MNAFRRLWVPFFLFGMTSFLCSQPQVLNGKWVIPSYIKERTKQVSEPFFNSHRVNDVTHLKLQYDSLRNLTIHFMKDSLALSHRVFYKIDHKPRRWVDVRKDLYVEKNNRYRLYFANHGNWSQVFYRIKLKPKKADELLLKVTRRAKIQFLYCLPPVYIFRQLTLEK